jgi:predicted AAA+ superfamily ATPase
LYGIFRLTPFGSAKIKAVKKERKHYHFDWSVVPDEAARFENLVASHLLKWAHFEQDTKGRDLEVQFLRDNTGREVDFVVTEDRKPVMLIECKWQDTEIAPSLRYFHEKFFGAQAFQLTAVGKKDHQTSSGVRMMPAPVFLKDLV